MIGMDLAMIASYMLYCSGFLPAGHSVNLLSESNLMYSWISDSRVQSERVVPSILSKTSRIRVAGFDQVIAHVWYLLTRLGGHEPGLHMRVGLAVL